MPLPPKKRKTKAPAAKPAPMVVAEEVAEPAQALVPTAADHFRAEAQHEAERSAEDRFCDTWDPSLMPVGLEDAVPTPVLVRMQAFVGHYLACLNGAEAARRAGYAEAHADKQARVLLKHPTVRQMLKDQHRALLAKIQTTQERVWHEISRIAFLDPAEAFDENGELKKLADMPEDLRRAIAGLKVTVKQFGDDETVEKEVKFVSKDAALDKLLRLTGMFKDEKTTADDVADAMLAALGRARQRVIEGQANAG
jgi:phage terminase small subunit